MSRAWAQFPVAVHVPFVRRDEILLLRHLNTGFEDGKLSVVAGHVEPGETVTQAAVRESREEVGLEDLPGDTIPYVRAGIESFRQGRWFQEFGWA